MDREQIAWGRLTELAPRGRYEHARTWEKHNQRRANFVRRIVRSGSGCWLWAGQKTMRRGVPYPTVSYKENGRTKSRSAFVWMTEEFFPELTATRPPRTQPGCGQGMCINPYHRVNGMVTRGVLTPERVREIYALKGTNAREVAVQFGVNHNHVLSIWSGRYWSEITGAVYQRQQRRVTPPEVVEAIRQRHGQASSRVVGAEFDVSNKTVLRIWNDEHRGLPQEQATC